MIPAKSSLLDHELCHSTSKPIGDKEDTLKSFMAFDIISCRPIYGVVVGSQIVVPPEVVATMSERTPLPNSMVEVEAMSCRRVVKFVSEVGIQEAIFEGDSLIVIQALNNGGASEASYGNLIDNIIFLASHLSKVEFSHVKRSCNRVADALAKKAKTINVFQAWIEDLPTEIAPLANFDVH